MLMPHNIFRKILCPWETYNFYWIKYVQAGLAIMGALGGAQSAGQAGGATGTGEEFLGKAGDEFGDISSQADKWLSRYDELYQPIERGLAERVAEGPQYARAEGEATADVAMSFDKARQIEERRMQRYGLDPSTGRYRSRGRQYDLGRAASEVGARNIARRQEEDRDWARRMAFTRMGRGLETSAVGAKATAGAGYGAIGRQYFGLADKYGQSAGRGFGAAGRMLSAFGGSGGGSGGGGGNELLGPSDSVLDTDYGNIDNDMNVDYQGEY